MLNFEEVVQIKKLVSESSEWSLISSNHLYGGGSKDIDDITVYYNQGTRAMIEFTINYYTKTAHISFNPYEDSKIKIK